MTLVPDYRAFDGTDSAELDRRVRAASVQPLGYRVAKRTFDLVFTTVLLLPATLFVALCLLALNPFFNPGPLFYRQKRMGRGCRPFRAIKFRTMTGRASGHRGPEDPVESHRIPRLGLFLRRSRFDELPQIFNVYLGQMSLIGPRPDYYRHAYHYMRAIPDYHLRHAVRPGISGLAQIELGYAEGVDATRLKTAADIDYIRRASSTLDAWIFWRTIVTVIGMRGA